MSLGSRVLGAPGQDNLLRVDVNAGTAIHRLQFDCGDRCLDALPPGEIKATDHLFFSHLHMDHVGGFDTFFRSNFERAGRPVMVWGPPGSAAILHHRFRGFWWNIVNDVPGTWIVHDVHPDRVEPYRFEAREAFADAHPLAPWPHDGTILCGEAFTVEVIGLPHHGTSLGYLVRERARLVVDRTRLAASGLPPGPWLRELKAMAMAGTETEVGRVESPPTTIGPAAPTAVPQAVPRAVTAAAGGAEAEKADTARVARAADTDGVDWIEVDGVRHDTRALAEALLVASPRESIAYVTDFLLDEDTFARLSEWLARVDTLVCESQYHPNESALAARNHHATIDRVAALARAADVGALVPFHLSERYAREDWCAMLGIARRTFPAASYPPHWGIGEGGVGHT